MFEASEGEFNDDEFEEEIRREQEWLEEEHGRAAAEAESFQQEFESGFESLTKAAGTEEQDLVTRSEARQIRKEAKKRSAEEKKENERKASENWTRLINSGALFLAAPLCPEEAVPPWVKDIEPSHRVYERGGLVVCARCAAFASKKPQRLLQRCAGNRGCLEPAIALIQKARLPRGVKRWPKKEHEGKNDRPPLRRVWLQPAEAAEESPSRLARRLLKQIGKAAKLRKTRSEQSPAKRRKTRANQSPA